MYILTAPRTAKPKEEVSETTGAVKEENQEKTSAKTEPDKPQKRSGSDKKSSNHWVMAVIILEFKQSGFIILL